MSSLQAIIIALIQGATELFPVSSLGHAVLVPALLGWQIDQAGISFLPFLVMLHLGTAAALLVYFWADWWALLLGVLGLASGHQNRESRRVLLLIVIATIPAVIIGFVLEHLLRRLFGAPMIVAVFLALNGLLLLATERLRRAQRTTAPRALASLTVTDALVIGLWQCGALVPGISRSGTTIAGALLRGISHAGAAHFSFLIATPIILGATVLEVPKLLHQGIAPGMFGISVVAAIIAGLTAFASTAFLMRYFRRNDAAEAGETGAAAGESWALDPFGYYCIAAGLGSLFFFLL